MKDAGKIAMRLASLAAWQIPYLDDKPAEALGNVARAICKAIALQELIEEHLDGECYCAEGVACKGPCSWCQAEGKIQAAMRGH